LKKILNYEILFKTEDWKNVNSDAKDLVKKMLSFNPNTRVTASEAISHPFLDMHSRKNKEMLKIGKEKKQNEKIEEAENKFAFGVLNNIKKLQVKDKFQQAVLAFIIHYRMNKEENAEFSKIFIAMDKNGDGQLSLDELKEGLEKIQGSSLNKFEIDMIVKNIGINAFDDERIEYEEFLRASLDLKILSCKQNLKLAFDNFDSNGDGFLSKDEICNALGDVEDKYLDALLKIVDLNKDGRVSYEEFESFMNSFIDFN